VVKARNARAISQRKWRARPRDFASAPLTPITPLSSLQRADLISTGGRQQRVSVAHAPDLFMSDTTQGAPAPKKRSLFKRAAWQDSPKTDEDIFSHSKDFKYIVAEQHRVEAEKKKKAEEERKRKLAGHGDKKRRKVSNDHDECVLPSSGSGSSRHANRTGSKA
jgi:hypothetical protein